MTTSTIQGIPVDPTPPANGDILQYNGTIYTPVAPNPGDITEVNTNLPLTGGGTGGALTLDINNFTGDGGAGGLDGAVPAPAAGDAAAGKFLKADGTWAVPGGGGMTLLSQTQDNNYITTNVNTFTLFMSDTFVSAGGDVMVFFETGLAQDASLLPHGAYYELRIDAAPVGGRYVGAADDTIINIPVNIAQIIPLAAGPHTVEVYWRKTGGVNAAVISTLGGADDPNLLYVFEVA